MKNRILPEKNRPWIKICGLTDPDNAKECVRLGADAIGLVFFEKSPRHVSLERATDITGTLPGHAVPIGVFVDESHDRILETVNTCGLKGVQLHGNEPPDLVDRLIEKDVIVIKALFAAREPFLTRAGAYENASFLLVEYGKGVLPGGNAEVWNYDLIREMDTRTPIILAGGLNPANIADAIRSANPAGVDVSSGVEARHGFKDLDRVKALISEVRSV